MSQFRSSSDENNTQQLAVAGMLTALIIVLRIVSHLIPTFGSFSIAAFSLVPVVMGAILYGPLIGGGLGGVFGLSVAIETATGLEVLGFVMFEHLPVLTIAICLIKGIAAGVAAGWVYRAFERLDKPFVGVLLAALACPVTNTLLFLIGMLAFFQNVVTEWMLEETAFRTMSSFVFVGIGVNFAIEVGVNLALASGIDRVLYAIRRRV